MNIECLVTGAYQENCYLLWNYNQQALVIDPGDNSDKMLKCIETKALNIIGYLCTRTRIIFALYMTCIKNIQLPLACIISTGPGLLRRLISLTLLLKNHGDQLVMAILIGLNIRHGLLIHFHSKSSTH